MADEPSSTRSTAVIEPPSGEAPPGAVPPPADPPTYAAPVPAAQRPVPTSAPVGWVIAGMILFWPTGIPALLASHRSARAIGAADAEVAVRETANARRWGIISVIVGGVLILVSALVSIVWVALVAVAVNDHDGGARLSPDRGFTHELPFGAPDGGARPGPQGSNG